MVTPASHASLPFSLYPIPIGFHLLLSGSQVFELMEQGTHFIEEMNIRGIDFREFSPELQEAFRKLQQEGKLEIQN